MAIDRHGHRNGRRRHQPDQVGCRHHVLPLVRAVPPLHQPLRRQRPHDELLALPRREDGDGPSDRNIDKHTGTVWSRAARRLMSERRCSFLGIMILSAAAAAAPGLRTNLARN